MKVPRLREERIHPRRVVLEAMSFFARPQERRDRIAFERVFRDQDAAASFSACACAASRFADLCPFSQSLHASMVAFADAAYVRVQHGYPAPF